MNTKEQKKRTPYKLPKFYLDKKESDKPEAIFLKFTFASGERLSYYTGQRIEPSKWQAETQRVKRNVTGGSDINGILDNLAETASKTVRDYKLQKKPLTKDIFKTILDKANNKQTAVEAGFSEIFSRFIETESKLKSWSKNTLTKLRTIQSQLEAFEASKRKKNRSYKIDMNQANERFFEELIEYWQKEHNLRNTTIEKHLRLVRWFLNWSYKKGLCNDSFKLVEVKLKEAKKQIVVLDMAEIGAIYRLQLPEAKQYLDRTRDIFIFQCLTGLRFSDLRNLKASDINGETIKVTTIKTGEVIEIQLNDTSRAILDKYKAHQEATGKALPVPVNQVFNKFLKELAKEAELDERITLVHFKGAERVEETFSKHELICSHTARRSFITNGLAMGISSEVLRSWTGHQSERSFKDYYKILKERQETDIQKFKL
jgi:integrase